MELSQALRECAGCADEYGGYPESVRVLRKLADDLETGMVLLIDRDAITKESLHLEPAGELGPASADEMGPPFT